MKKFLVFALAVLMFATPVMAEGNRNAETTVNQQEVAEEQTRTATIEIEGIEEEVLEYQYVSESGYTLWYSAEHFEPLDYYDNAMFVPVGETTEENTLSFMVVPTEVAVEDADSMLAEATASYDPETVGMINEMTTEQGIVIKSVDVDENDQVTRFYLVIGEDRVLCITAQLPVEALEGAGVRFNKMAESIEFTDVAEEADGETVDGVEEVNKGAAE